MLLKKALSKWLVLALCLGLVPGLAIAGGGKGLSKSAFEELEATGINKYLGEFSPVRYKDMGDGWVKHTFDPAAGNGPVCITGTEYSVYTRKGKNPRQLLIMLQGGGACWQGFYQCPPLLAGGDIQEPPFPREGIWDFDNKANPFHKHSVVFMPYCDGSVFLGDNDVLDEDFAAALAAADDPIEVEPIRYHRGLRNLSAGMDVAGNMFPKPRTVTVAGTSAGGVGAMTFAPFLARFEYGNKLKKLTVLNDAGPIGTNPEAVDAVAFRAADWRFDQLYPKSCTECDAQDLPTAPLIDWRLANDSRIREAFYGTDGDATAIVFISINLPGSPPVVPFDPVNGVFGLDQVTYRALFLPRQDRLNSKYPDRFKRFIVSGDDSHTALQLPLLYEQDANGVLLNEWIADFLGNKKGWVDIVEDFQPLP